MAGQGRIDDEMEALTHIEGVDAESITAQISGKKPEVKTPATPPTTPPAATTPPATPPTTPPAATTPPAEPPKTTPPTENVPNPEIIRNAMLSEMFGEQFKTVEDFKKANIPGQLSERDSLRQKVTELETQLKAKPKHAFASDDIAKFNEFVRDTGIKDAGIFNTLNSTDIANMDDLDALVWQRVVDDPYLAAELPRVRKNIERKFNVDKGKLDNGDLTQEEYDDNLYELRSEARKAKEKLTDLKSKIRMPEVQAEDDKPKGWTPEILSEKKNQWSEVNQKMSDEFAKIPIHMKGYTEPIVNFTIPEETRKAITSNALNYAVSNQMEINEANVKSIAQMMYSNLIVSNLNEITQAVFERARTINEKEYLEKYHNPSPLPKDNVPKTGGVLTEDEIQEAAYQLETKR
jgi:hypothetical protein